MRALSGIIVVTLLGAAYCFHIIVEDEGSPAPVPNPESQSPLQSEEFQQWLQLQRELTVQKIMDKIADPSDTVMQHDAKIVVARYLVNVTFAAMTRRLENYGKSIPESFAPESITTPLPTGENNTVPVPEQPTITLTFMPMESEMENNPEAGNEMEQIVEEKITILVEEATSGPTDEETTAPIVEETTIINIQEEIVPIIIDTKIVDGGSALPASSPNQQFLPASSPVTTAPEAEPIIPTIFVNKNDNQAVPASSPDNNTETTTSGPLWQQFLTFNFSAISGGGVRLPFNISLTGLRGEGGNRLPFNLSLSALRGEGGNRLPFNFTLPSIGGDGSGPRLPFNLTALRGEGGARLPFNISLTALGGEGGARLPFNLTFPALGGEGGPRLPFNISLSGLLNSNNNNNSSNSSAGSEGGGLFANLPPPPTFNFPTPPPMNDSVRMSQMYLMAQVDRLVSGINSQNLTGIVDSTVNLATPSSVGVLVNALLNLVLCNPLDRWHGNCGIE